MKIFQTELILSQVEWRFATYSRTTGHTGKVNVYVSDLTIVLIAADIYANIFL
uniref:Uncharacterized protein n=1 Tax=Arion vulgaris TaxID=1028688 RepID=A0A0B7B4U1_9EUPU